VTFPRLGLSARLILLTVCLVLFSQLINVVILVRAQTELRQERFEAILSERVVQTVRLAEIAPNRARRLSRRGGPRSTIVDEPTMAGNERPRLEAKVRSLLDDEGYTDRQLVVRELSGNRRPTLRVSVQLSNERWVQTNVPLPPSARPPWRPIILQTVFLTAMLMLPAIWIGRRVAMPLRGLTAAADGFLTGKPSPPLPERGPPDVQALSAAFAKLEERILGALEEKSMMIGAIGHDLRTPLASLRIRVESVEDEALRDEMIASMEHLNATLEDILTFSKATRREALEEIRTDALIRRLLQSYPAANIAVAEEQVATLTCASEAILRALRNLLNNAQQHGGGAELAVEILDEQVALHVRDKGPGIPADQLEALQRPFQRAEGSRNRSHGGAGLGLAIARAVAKAHGGDLRLSNRQGGGLQASMILPLKPPPARANNEGAD